MGSITRRLCPLLASACLITGAAACTSGGDPTRSTTHSGATVSPAARATPDEPLQFRPVLSVSTGSCPTGKASYIRDGQDGSCVRLAAPALTVTQLRSVHATRIQGGTWAVQVVLQPADRARFTTLTTKLTRKRPPRNQLAMVLGTTADRRLLTAPSVQSPIATGSLQITGGLTRSSAQRLVHDLGG